MCIPELLKIELLIPKGEFRRARRRRQRRPSSPSPCPPARPVAVPTRPHQAAAPVCPLPPHIAPTFWRCICAERPHTDFDVCPACLRLRVIQEQSVGSCADSAFSKHLCELIRCKQEEHERRCGGRSTLFDGGTDRVEPCASPPPPQSTPIQRSCSRFDDTQSADCQRTETCVEVTRRISFEESTSEPTLVKIRPRRKRSPPWPQGRTRRPAGCHVKREVPT